MASTTATTAAKRLPSLPLWAWRVLAWSAGLGPLAWGIWLVFSAGLGANPVEFLEHYTGTWALRLLLLTLCITPLQRLAGQTQALRVRRVLGLWAYALVCLHLAIYAVFDLSLSPAALAEDLVKRTYITVGFAAWLLLLPLAITSTQGWQKRLKRRWKTLHRLIYPAVLLGGLHYLWLVKADVRVPLVYLGLWSALMLVRIPWRQAQ